MPLQINLILDHLCMNNKPKFSEYKEYSIKCGLWKSIDIEASSD